MSDVTRTSVNQSPGGGTDYPFVDQVNLAGKVLDFYLSYKDTPCAYLQPFALVISGTTVTVIDANAQVVVTAERDASNLRAWGTRQVREWISDPWVMRMVTASFEDGSGTLDPRTCNRLPARITSVRVGTVKLTGNVTVQAGYNISLSGVSATAVDGGRFINSINLDAVPGAGAGRYGGCADVTPLLRKINQIVPDCGGNFIIEADACFRAQLPLSISGSSGEARTAEYEADGYTTEQAKAALRLTSDCHPCCECDYYVRTYRGLKRVWSFWQADAVAAEAVRDTYEANRQRWLDSKQCRIDNPARLVTGTDANCKTFIGGSFCNFTSCCLTAIELRFTLQRYKAGVEIPWTSGTVVDAYISGSSTVGDEAYAPMKRGPVLRFFVDYADPQAMSIAKMKFCTTNCDATESLKATMTVHVAAPPPNSDTGDTCDMTTASVPDDIQSIWTDNGVPGSPTVRATLTQTAALNPNSPTFNCGC